MATQAEVWRADILASGERTWASNALTFASREEALSYASELSGRWMAVKAWRAVLDSTPRGETYVPGTEDGSW